MLIKDINECSSNTDNCHPDSICRNSVGSFTCTCNSGFTGNGVSCSGIHFNNKKTNLSVKINFKWLYVFVLDIDECRSVPCDTHATCINNPGLFSCYCNSGYTGDGINCNGVS